MNLRVIGEEKIGKLVPYLTCKLSPYIEEAVKRAFAEKDGMWVLGLEGLSRKMGVEDADFSDPEIPRILGESDN